MLAHDAAELANVLRRSMTIAPNKRDVAMISRALKRVITDDKRKNAPDTTKYLTKALSLATHEPFNEVRDKFQRQLRSAIACLVDERARKKTA
jgi:hypothetical protein